MKRTIVFPVMVAIVLGTFAAIRQPGKLDAFALLQEHGEVGDWHFLGRPLAEDSKVPHWLPGVWPWRLTVDVAPLDPARYAAAVRKLPRLEKIHIRADAPMSLDIYAALGQLPGARLLEFSSTGFNDAAFQKFTQVATVEEMTFWRSTITDAAVPHLLEFRRLQNFNVVGSAMSNAAVPELARIPTLKFAGFIGFSHEAVAALHNQRPDLLICD